ncbi:hypothetical protein SAY87_022086 [Trapa incisa]|uniref:Uncharacterized protein n=1 Tax=Trapa incisa TaxID=236973 RepID=A0AAN7PTB7_9MYRT|nr:hypothetical protein SAY87_022086 [Trapa incisa]
MINVPNYLDEAQVHKFIGHENDTNWYNGPSFNALTEQSEEAELLFDSEGQEGMLDQIIKPQFLRIQWAERLVGTWDLF